MSNFDVDDLEEALSLSGGDAIATNQVLYNLRHRGIEWDLLPWCKDRNIPIMAYSPLEQRSFVNHPQLKEIALQHNATPTQIALNWLLRQNNIISIPKATNANYIKENRAALEINLTENDLKEIDRIFPPPNRKQTLAMR